jgi:DNA repair exonuclease SbcCD ATPase subunit
MEEHLDRLGRQVAEARMAYDREKKEADAIAQLSRQRLAAAEHLQRQIEGETDPARKATLEKSLETLVGLLEQMAPEVEREAQDATDAEEFLRMLEQTYAQAGEKLKTARSELTRAERDMARAAQQRSVAEQRAEAARQAAGLSSATSGLGMALKAMQDTAAREMATAEAANTKARLLKPTRPEEDDPDIKAALQAATGALPGPTDLTGRLAAIRARQA